MCTTFNMWLKNTTPKYVSSKKTHVWFSQKKTSNKHTKLFPETEQLAFSNFSCCWNVRDFRICCPLPTVGRVCRVFRVPGSHRHELQLEAHDHQIKPRGFFQPSARFPRWFVGPQTGHQPAELPGRKILDDTEGGKICGTAWYVTLWGCGVFPSFRVFQLNSWELSWDWFLVSLTSTNLRTKILEYQNVTPMCYRPGKSLTKIYQNKEMVLKRVGPTCAISKIDFQFVNGNSNHPILQQTSTNLRNSLPKVAGDYQLTRLINQVCSVKTEVPHNFPMEDSLSLGFLKVPAGFSWENSEVTQTLSHLHEKPWGNYDFSLPNFWDNFCCPILFVRENPGFSNPTDRLESHLMMEECARRSKICRVDCNE